MDFTQSAVSDLESISAYTLKTWGPEREENYLRNLYRKFTQIAEDPHRWRFREDLFPLCQVAHAGKHIILFLINGADILIVRMLHMAMDLKKHIPEEVR